MDTQQVVYKISGYCLNQYPNLEWNIIGKYANKTVICGVDFPFKVTLKICSDKRNEVSSYKEETTDDYIIGHFDLVNVGWLGMFGIHLNCDKKIDFRSLPITKEWDKKDWDLYKKYREVMLGIFNFIANEIQE
jgi:hypothetical protein